MPKILKPAKVEDPSHLSDDGLLRVKLEERTEDTRDKRHHSTERSLDALQLETSAVEPQTRRLRHVVEQAECLLQEARDAWRQRWEQDAVRLACRIAARCLRELPFDSEALTKQLVDESLRGVRLEGGCEVRLHPDDYRALTEDGQLNAHDVVVLPDSKVERGGCVVRTPDGVIDQTLTAQLARVEQELTQL